MLNVSKTIISQYANSNSIRALLDSWNEDIDPRADLDAFYNAIWNVQTAYGYGLDVWGRIVGVSRLLNIPSNEEFLGFVTPATPYDWDTFNNGIFFSGYGATQTYLLPDDAYRTLILAKALANISATTARGINRVLQQLFPNRGKCYVVDGFDMTMTYVFEFELSVVEYAILTNSGVLPHPAGVGYTVDAIAGISLTLGFLGSDLQPFNVGTFFTRE